MSFSKRLALTYIRTKFRVLSAVAPKKAARDAFALFCTPRHRNKKDLPPVFSDAEVLRFTFKDYHIQGYEWNKGGARTALILHGFESSIVNFDQYIGPLVGLGFRVLGFDAPAHGRSSGDFVNVLLYKQFIELVHERFGPVDAYLAHSLGGLSLSLALEPMPGTERLRVALIAPATETTTAIADYFRFLRLPGSLRPVFDDLIEERSGQRPEWFSVARAVRHLKAQVLWVHDQDDDMTPISDVHPVRKAGHNNVRFYITKGLGHRRVYRDPNVQQKVLEFLDGVKAG
ncbi:alpha/beta hydrolase [Flaviaesturariibacter amylovorans]|uniref:Alpha/beta hydrolase n=1 Tax=Flaviaesturariibacter amylovorans TaxID=1084520 RepID=A0ABP8GU37_9BACT